MGRVTALLLVGAWGTLSATYAAAACLPAETPVNGSCASRVINHFAVGTLTMVGNPIAGDRPPPPAAKTYSVGTIMMTGLGGPPVVDVGVLQLTGIAAMRLRIP